MAKQHITSEDVMNYYAEKFGDRRQFEAMRLDSGNKEYLTIIDLNYDFMVADRDYYKITMKKMLEKEWPDLQYSKHNYTNLVKRFIIDENGNEVEYSPRLPTTKLSELPGKMFDSSKTEYFKDWLSTYNIV